MNDQPKVIDLRAIQMRRDAQAKQQATQAAARSLCLPVNGSYRARKIDALQKLLPHVKNIVLFSPEENYRSTTSPQKLSECALLFPYDLYLSAINVLQMVFVGQINVTFDLYLEKPVEISSAEVHTCLAALIQENRQRGNYVSTNLLQWAMPA